MSEVSVPATITPSNIPNADHPLFERQLALEQEMTTRGIERALRAVNNAKANGRESNTFYGSYLMRRAVVPVAEAITAFLDEAATGKPGRRHCAVPYLRRVKPELAAFVALRACLDMVCIKVSLQNAAVRIGTAIETEVRLEEFERQDKAAYRRAQKLTEGAGHEGYKRAVFSYIASDNGVTWESWLKADKLHIGIKLIEIVRDVTGYIDYTAEKNRSGDYVYHLVGTPRCLEWINNRLLHTELFTPEYLPTIIPPRPWTDPHTGGYYSICRPLRLVKTGKPNYMEELSNRVDDMPILYEAVNAMQATGYRVNRMILDVMRDLWDAGGDEVGIPNRENKSLPRCPVCGASIETRSGKYRPKQDGAHACFELEEYADAFKQWKRAAGGIYDSNIATMSRRLQFAKCLWLAEKFQDEEAIWFPMQFDFRGRAYAVAGFLNPQGPDHAKALLEFSEGKEVNTQEALDWLAVHGANTFGNDKVSLEDRVTWVRDNEADILAAAEDPYRHRWWQEADKPWQFLAFCFEWQDYKARAALGKPFISHLPVAMDGTCNGLQIFSLMLRDEEGGLATNLIPCEKPQDIYAIVAEKVTARLREKRTTGKEVYKKDEKGSGKKASKKETLWYDERDMAERLLALGVNRKTTKRQVMVLPYGGTFQSCCDYTLEHLKERMEAGDCENLLDKGNIFPASRFLALLIWESIGDTVQSARTAMEFLQRLATIAAAEGLPVNWHTPIGFIVSQAYMDMKTRRVKTRIGDSIIKLVIQEEPDEKNLLDRRRQRNGISPNFVHSLDGAAMCLSISKARARGVSSFMMIHDSYGTHVADAPKLGLSLREAFVDLFGGTGTNLLAGLRDEVAAMLPLDKRDDLPELPPTGNLDVNEVLYSAYFFA